MIAFARRFCLRLHVFDHAILFGLPPWLTSRYDRAIHDCLLQEVDNFVSISFSHPSGVGDDRWSVHVYVICEHAGVEACRTTGTATM